MRNGLIVFVVLAILVVSAERADAQDPRPPQSDSAKKLEQWGSMEPGQGFELAKTEYGDLWVSAYALFRYLNQLPKQQTYIDHLGVERVIDTRHDLQWHRVQAFLKGWVYNERLRYTVNFWTVNATGQVALAGMLRFRVNHAIDLGAGINGMPGTRTLRGSHPYWMGHDRVMADEFFRPGFTSALWAEGEAVPRFFYNIMVGTNLGQLGVSASEDTRDFPIGASIWWLPTTGEFGPRGGFGDYEIHDKLATRIGASAVTSREDRFSILGRGPENTTIRLQDAVNLFETGALAPDITVERATYRLLSFDVGAKYRGFFIAAEMQNRWLDHFAADGPLPVDGLYDYGFYVQASWFVKPATIELYASTSYVIGDEDAGFDTSDERIVGINYYPFKTRNVRLNTQFIDVNQSAVNSVFGYYMGGLDGQILSIDFSVLF